MEVEEVDQVVEEVLQVVVVAEMVVEAVDEVLQAVVVAEMVVEAVDEVLQAVVVTEMGRGGEPVGAEGEKSFNI